MQRPGRLRSLTISRALPALTLTLGLAGSLAGCGASSTSLSGNGTFQSTLAPSAAGVKSDATATIDTANLIIAPGAPQGDGGTRLAAAHPSGSGIAVPASLAKLTQAQKPSSKGYKIGADDMVEISVFKVPELSKVAQVGDSGMISYPLIGDVQAAGRTAAELERDLAAKLGAKYLQNPQVTVTVKEYNSQRVLVDGAFAKPGVYPIRGQATLLQFVASSGGLTPNAESVVVVFRTVEGKQMAARFNVEDIRAGKDSDPEVKPGDVIVASTSAFKEGLDKFLKVLPAVGTFAQVATVL